MTGSLEALQAAIRYRFSDTALLERALTHASWLQDNPGSPGNNQRLEFLGDSVLQLVLTKELFTLFPAEREGELTKRRAILGKGAFLSGLAREVGINSALRLGANEESLGGRERDAALEDAFEAVIGAVELDGGFEAARAAVLGIYGDLLARLSTLEGAANPKGRLQEIVQPLHGNQALRYEVVATEGADHEKRYEVAVFLLERRIGSGRGTSKKVAEEEAARAGLETLQSAQGMG
jgi:ribonuclease-3